jgi:hypothetical protein
VDEESFKVTDRRRHPGEPAREAARPSSSEAESSPAARPSGERATGEARTPPGLASRDLRGVFLMFATSALIGLGEAADPVSGERSTDLDQARDAIDTLLLLRDRTEGRRTHEEDMLLGQLLYDLQMRFVHVTRRSSGSG